MVCPFCNGEQKYIKNVDLEIVKEHLIVTLDENEKFHVHGPIHNKMLIKTFILTIAKEAGIEIEDEE